MISFKNLRNTCYCSANSTEQSCLRDILLDTSIACFAGIPLQSLSLLGSCRVKRDDDTQMIDQSTYHGRGRNVPYKVIGRYSFESFRKHSGRVQEFNWGYGFLGRDCNLGVVSQLGIDQELQGSVEPDFGCRSEHL